MTSSGPESQSSILMSSGVVCELSIFLSWTQVWHSFTHLRTWFAIDGKYYFCLISCLNLEISKCLAT